MTEIITECLSCDKNKNLNEFQLICFNCEESLRENEIKDLLVTLSSRKPWDDEELLACFKSPEDTQTFLRGMKYARMDLLFGVADYFDMVEFYDGLRED